MGYASQIAIGIALHKRNSRIICFDGDGALIMHMGGLPYSGLQKNLIHIVLNNGSHESVGGQPTIAKNLKLTDIAKSCNFDLIFCIKNEKQIEKLISKCFRVHNKSIFIEVLCQKGHRSDLGRPKKVKIK